MTANLEALAYSLLVCTGWGVLGLGLAILSYPLTRRLMAR